MFRKHFFLVSLLFSQLCLKAQFIKDSVISPQKSTQIELVYNHYLQDGNNSAVTGGVGTEKLTVYGPSANLKKINGYKTFNVHLGIDIISSASTDKIDFVVSSASSRDARYYTDISYDQPIADKWSLLTGMAFSIESDYFSQGYKAGIKKEGTNKDNTFALQLQYFNDDLRWGRINPSYYRPERLIYPSELRFQEWFSTTKRNSYNIKAGWTRRLNNRNLLALFPEIAYQTGLLATPFHRVYFTDNSIRVENLPDHRLRASVGLKLHTAISEHLILKNTVNGYTDDFGIQSFSFENETVFRINPFMMLMPGVRVLTQKSSRYFAPYQQHQLDKKYYTSDYDLSDFETITFSLGLKYHPYIFLGRKILFDTMILRYNYMHRTNGLNAHFMSVILQSEYFSKKK